MSDECVYFLLLPERLTLVDIKNSFVIVDFLRHATVTVFVCCFSRMCQIFEMGDFLTQHAEFCDSINRSTCFFLFVSIYTLKCHY